MQNRFPAGLRLNPPLGCGWPHVVQLRARFGASNQTVDPEWLLGTPDTGAVESKARITRIAGILTRITPNRCEAPGVLATGQVGGFSLGGPALRPDGGVRAHRGGSGSVQSVSKFV